MLVYAMLCSDAIMPSVISKYFGIFSLNGNFFSQKCSYMLFMISLFLSPSSPSFAPTLLQTVKKTLYPSSGVTTSQKFKSVAVANICYWVLAVSHNFNPR